MIILSWSILVIQLIIHYQGGIHHQCEMSFAQRMPPSSSHFLWQKWWAMGCGGILSKTCVRSLRSVNHLSESPWLRLMGISRVDQNTSLAQEFPIHWVIHNIKNSITPINSPGSSRCAATIPVPCLPLIFLASSWSLSYWVLSIVESHWQQLDIVGIAGACWVSPTQSAPITMDILTKMLLRIGCQVTAVCFMRQSAIQHLHVQSLRRKSSTV